MQNKYFPLLTQKMLDENPNLSGTFYVKSRVSVLPSFPTNIKKGYIYLKDGCLHNENGPAYIFEDLMVVEFYQNGNRRTESLCSAILYGKPGKLDGIVFIAPHDTDTWHKFLNNRGIIHRLSGPAYINSLNSSFDEYFIDGVSISKHDWEKSPKVIEYNKNFLKKKMKQVFGEYNNGK